MYCSVKASVSSPASVRNVWRRVKSGIRIELNLITGKLFPETSHFRLEYPGLEFPVRATGLAEDVTALGLGEEMFED